MNAADVVELKHTLAGMAELTRAYYDELRKQGFDRRQALQLTLGWQQVIFSNANNQKTDDDNTDE